MHGMEKSATTRAAAVISGAEEKLTELYALSSMGEGMIVAIATIGTICGAAFSINASGHFSNASAKIV